MKRKLLILLSLPILFTFVSCEKELESEGVNTKITYYATFTMTGSPLIFHEFGTPFTEPGIIAEENGVALPIETTVSGIYRSNPSGTVDGNRENKYDVKYSAINSDGYPGSTSRSIYVFKTGDFVTSIEGLYTATVVRTPSQGSVPADKVLSYVIIWKNTDGSYGISNGDGAYYELGRGLGYNYIAPGCTFSYDLGTSTFTPGSVGTVNTFGDPLSVTALTVDAVNKKMTLTSHWATGNGYNFIITLTQVQP